jgi:riboflavin kinase / FMN adenylyltransferase
VHLCPHRTLSLNSSVITVGAFDGVHLGHQRLIQQAVKRARTLKVPSVVYTFNPSPRVYFQNSMEVISLHEKIQVMKQQKVDYLVIADFNKEYASRPAEAFMDELALMGAKEIWVGDNFQFGKGKEGTADTLASKFKVHVLPLMTCEKGEVISSTRIRKLLKTNELTEARRLLGRTCLETSII